MRGPLFRIRLLAPASILCFLASSSEAKKLNFFQISDLHLDSRYSESGSVENRCHDLNADDDDSNSNSNLSPAGDYDCDAPLALVESAIRHMKTVEPDPDFILWSGDSSPHWHGVPGGPPDIAYVTSNLRNITKLLRSYFDESVPIIPALGNHDTSPPDQYPDLKVDKAASLAWFSAYIEQGSWGDLIPKASQDDFKKCGFYAYPLLGGGEVKVKFLVLNTDLYYYNEAQLDGVDPCGQLEWLRNQLDGMADDEQAFVMAHVPPGYFERDLDVSRPTFTIKNHTDLSFEIMKQYVDIFTNKTNAKKVTYHFYGHIHLDVFRLFMSNLNQAVGVGFVAPSVTPLVGWGQPFVSHGTNPSHRLYTYDTETRTMDNYVSHYLNLRQLNGEQQRVASPQESSDDGLLGSEKAAAGGDRSARNSKFSSAFRKGTRLRRAEPALPVDQEHDDFTEAVPVGDVAQNSTQRGVTNPEETSTTAELATTPRAVDSENATKAADRADTDADATTTTINTTTDSTTTKLPVSLPEPSSPMVAELAKKWEIGYSAVEAFNSTDLSPKAMQKAYVDMLQHPGDPTFKKYFKHSSMFHGDDEECDEACHHDSMCAIAFLRVGDMQRCLDISDEQMLALGIGIETITKKPDVETITKKPDAGTGGDDADKPRPGSVPTEVTIITTSTTTTQKTVPVTDMDLNVVHDSGPKSEPSNGDAGTLSGVAIGFSVVLVLGLAVGGLFLFRKVQSNRYRSQEFLLTDSIFRYDGYSHVDGP